MNKKNKMKKRTTIQKAEAEVNTEKANASFNQENLEEGLNEQNEVFRKIISQLNSNIPDSLKTKKQ